MALNCWLQGLFFWIKSLIFTPSPLPVSLALLGVLICYLSFLGIQYHNRGAALRRCDTKAQHHKKHLVTSMWTWYTHTLARRPCVNVPIGVSVCSVLSCSGNNIDAGNGTLNCSGQIRFPSDGSKLFHQWVSWQSLDEKGTSKMTTDTVDLIIKRWFNTFCVASHQQWEVIVSIWPSLSLLGAKCVYLWVFRWV